MAPTTSATGLISSVYDCFRSGNIPGILDLVAPGAKWQQSSMLPWGGEHRVPEGAAEFFRRLNETMETVAFDVRENVQIGNEVFSFGIYSGRSRQTGRTGTAEWMFRWRVEGGRIVSYESYTDSAALLAAMQ